MSLHRQRALAVVVAVLAALSVIPMLGGGQAAKAQTSSSTACNYPFDNCPTTTVGPPTTTPESTTTTRHGPPTSHPGPPTSHPGPPTSHPGPPTSTPGHGPPSSTPGNGPPGQNQLVLILDVTAATPGGVVRAKICGSALPPGASVRITFNGEVVATATVGTVPVTCTSEFALPRGRSGVVAAIGAGRILAQAQTLGAQTSFRVPTNLAPRSYLVCAESPGFASDCKPFTIVSDASVLGTTFSGSAPLVSATNPNSFLAFTGMGLLRLLLLAGVLIAVGWFLIRREQVRRA